MPSANRSFGSRFWLTCRANLRKILSEPEMRRRLSLAAGFRFGLFKGLFELLQEPLSEKRVIFLPHRVGAYAARSVSASSFISFSETNITLDMAGPVGHCEIYLTISIL